MRSLHLPILRGLREDSSFAGAMDRLLTDRRFMCMVYCTFGGMLRETYSVIRYQRVDIFFELSFVLLRKGLS